MREAKKRAPTIKHQSIDIRQAKRKRLDDSGEEDGKRTGIKKKNLLFKTKTLTLKPHFSSPKLTTSNRFLPNCYHRRSDNSSTIAKCNRRWVFSDTDFSAYKGIRNFLLIASFFFLKIFF